MATISKATYDAFIAAGVDDAKATAAAEAVLESGQLATKADIARLEGKIAELEARLTWRMIAVVGVINAMTVAIIKFN